MASRMAARRVFLLVAGFLVLAGCGPTPEQPVTRLSEIGADSVLVVGRLELRPPLRPNEQQIKAGTIDPFGVGDTMRERGFLWFGRSADTPAEKGDFVMNPRLGESYFLRVPKNTPYMLGGYIMAQYVMKMTSPRSVAVDDARIEIPGGVRYDIRPGDHAIYVGTLVLYRDEFNEVTKAVFVDDYAAATAAFRQRFGQGTELRKAIPRTQAPRAASR
ncbi:MAG TPA: hypothetical protein VJO12_14315 [Stellaceae bacterium]|nr:hypothetical protein [Stellaceae bacterium]